MTVMDPVLHEVWAGNLDENFAQLRKLARKATHVVATVEFPGVCLTPMGTFYSREHFTYQQLLINVNCMKPLQVGLALVTEIAPVGNYQTLGIFQFNLSFNPAEDMLTEEAQKAFEGAGINLLRHKNEGIGFLEFGELLTTTGLIASKITWISLNAAFDFGFLVRSVCGGCLPADIREFHRMFRKYFLTSYDVRHILQHPSFARRAIASDADLYELADALNLSSSTTRYHAAHEAAMLARIFFHLKVELQNSWTDIARHYSGYITGIGDEPVLPQGAVIQSIFAAKANIGKSALEANGTSKLAAAFW